MSTNSEPTTQDIKDAFVWVDGYPYEGHASAELGVLFDSWLAEHDREVAEVAWDDGYGPFRQQFPGRKNPHANALVVDKETPK